MAEWMGTRRDGRWPPTAARADVGRRGRVVTCLHLLGRRVCHGPPGIPCGSAPGRGGVMVWRRWVGGDVEEEARSRRWKKEMTGGARL